MPVRYRFGEKQRGKGQHILHIKWRSRCLRGLLLLLLRLPSAMLTFDTDGEQEAPLGGGEQEKAKKPPFLQITKTPPPLLFMDNGCFKALFHLSAYNSAHSSPATSYTI